MKGPPGRIRSFGRLTGLLSLGAWLRTDPYGFQDRHDEDPPVPGMTCLRVLADVGDYAVDLVVIDVSFISLTLILPAAKEILKSSGYIIALIKPQFEVGKKALGKSGIVTNVKEREKSIEKIRDSAKALDLVERDLTSAPQRQNKNIEFLILLSKK